jgi:hypothetical protein
MPKEHKTGGPEDAPTTPGDWGNDADTLRKTRSQGDRRSGNSKEE